jgi:hypothetical protein
MSSDRQLCDAAKAKSTLGQFSEVATLEVVVRLEEDFT